MVNVGLMKSPQNWITIMLMVIIASFAINSMSKMLSN